MRTQIEINDTLMQEAMSISPIKVKKIIVEQALKEYIKSLRRQDLIGLRGQVNWEGNLEEWRTSSYNEVSW